MIHLEKVTVKNFWDIVDLSVDESQEDFVAPNMGSVAEAYLTVGTECSAFPFGIYDDETPVGFLMIGYNLSALFETADVLKNNYLLWRLMIDKKHQKKGYGREALRLALEFVRTQPCGKAEYCVTSYEPENVVAKKLYSSFGFAETGEKDDGEDIAVLKL